MVAHIFGLIKVAMHCPEFCFCKYGNPNRTSTNAKNHIIISISTHLYRAAFNKRTVLDALSKLIYSAAWLYNQCFLQSPAVELGPLFIMILR